MTAARLAVRSPLMKCWQNNVKARPMSDSSVEKEEEYDVDPTSPQHYSLPACSSGLISACGIFSHLDAEEEKKALDKGHEARNKRSLKASGIYQKSDGRRDSVLNYIESMLYLEALPDTNIMAAQSKKAIVNEAKIFELEMFPGSILGSVGARKASSGKLGTVRPRSNLSQDPYDATPTLAGVNLAKAARSSFRKSYAKQAIANSMLSKGKLLHPRPLFDLAWWSFSFPISFLSSINDNPSISAQSDYCFHQNRPLSGECSLCSQIHSPILQMESMDLFDDQVLDSWVISKS